MDELLVASRARVARAQELCKRSLESCRRSAVLCSLSQDAFYRLQSRALANPTPFQSELLKTAI